MTATYGENHAETRVTVVEETPAGPRVRYTLPGHTAPERVAAYAARVAASGNPVTLGAFTVPR